MVDGKSIAPDPIPTLLRLDPSVPDEAARLRRGILTLTGWRAEKKPDGYWYLICLYGAIKPPERYDDESSVWSHAPKVERDLDAAMTLLDGLFWAIWREGDNDEIVGCAIGGQYDDIEDLYYHGHKGEAPYPLTALAVCRAWLVCKQAELARRDNQRIAPDNPTTTVSSHTIEFDTGCERDEPKGGENGS